MWPVFAARHLPIGVPTKRAQGIEAWGWPLQVIRDKGCGHWEDLWGEMTLRQPISALFRLWCSSSVYRPRTLLSSLPAAFLRCQGCPHSWLIASRNRFTACSFCSWPCRRFGDKANGFRESWFSCFLPFLTYLFALERKAGFSVLSHHRTFGAAMPSDFSPRSKSCSALDSFTGSGTEQSRRVPSQEPSGVTRGANE